MIESSYEHIGRVKYKKVCRFYFHLYTKEFYFYITEQSLGVRYSRSIDVGMQKQCKILQCIRETLILHSKDSAANEGNIKKKERRGHLNMTEI